MTEDDMTGEAGAPQALTENNVMPLRLLSPDTDADWRLFHERTGWWHAQGVPWGAAGELVKAGIYTLADLEDATRSKFDRLRIRRHNVRARILALLDRRFMRGSEP